MCCNLKYIQIILKYNIKRYSKAKFKLLKNQSYQDLAFVKKDDKLINTELKLNKFKNKIIKVDTKIKSNFLKNINNKYFLNETNRENLLFVLEISKKLKLNKKKINRCISKL